MILTSQPGLDSTMMKSGVHHKEGPLVLALLHFHSKPMLSTTFCLLI